MKILPDVRNLTHADYESALMSFVDGLRSCGGVRSIRRFGSWQTPGVSDVDVLVVTENMQWRRVQILCEQLRGSSPLLRYVLVHQAVVVPESLVPYLPYVHTTSNGEHVWGDTTSASLLPNVEKPVKLIRYVVWTSFMWRALLEMAESRIGLRGFLLRLNTGIYSAAIGLSIAGHPESSLIISLRALREELLGAPVAELDERCQAAYYRVIRAMADADWCVHEWAVSSA